MEKKEISVNHQLIYKDFGDGYKFHINTPKTKTGRPLMPSAVNNVLYNIIDAYNKADVYYDENVPLFRRNGYRKSGTMILRVRSRDTVLKSPGL